jgi:[ribosomal protein S5]-alanine N-acetyltransferase
MEANKKQGFYLKLEKDIPGSNGGTGKERIYLTRISMDGLSDFHEYSVSNPIFYKYLEYEPFKTIDDSRKYLRNLLELEKDIENRTCISWFIRLKDSDKVIGTARLVNIDYYRKSVSWGYGISPVLWGSGLVFEIQKILSKYIFETLSLNRLSGVARIDNLLTISTLRAFGVKEEGVQREAMRDFNGVYYDTWLYSMLRDEYLLSQNKVEKNKVKTVVSSTGVDLIIKELTQEEFEVNDNLRLSDIPDWDSLMQMQLISALEKKYDIQFTMEEILCMDTIISIKKIISKLSISSEIC